jgi:hypothetical protein
MRLFQSTAGDEITSGFFVPPRRNYKRSILNPEKYGQIEIKELLFTSMYGFGIVNEDPNQQPHDRIACIDKTTCNMNLT